MMLTGTATEALTTALSGCATEMTGLIGSVIPVAMPVVTGVLVITFGIKIFKKVTGR